MSLLVQDERLTRRVGAITLCVLGAAIVFFVVLRDRLELGSRTRIHVYFHHSAGLREHAALMVGGQTIGHIESIDSVPHGGSNPLHGEVGVVAIVAIDGAHAWKVPRGAEIFVASKGALSERYLEVAPPKGEPGPTVRDGEEMLAADPPSLDNVLQNTWVNMITLRGFVDAVKPELQAFRTELDALRAHLDATAADIDALRPAIGAVGPLATEASELIARARETYAHGLGGQAGFDRFAAMVRQARVTVAQTRATLDQLEPRASELVANLRRVRGHLEAHDPVAQLEATIARVRTVLDKVDPLLAKVDEINQRLAKGEGSIGRLMNDPEFPEDAKELGKIMKRQPWKIIARPKE
jgi:ABC-type transporter Mla subunit MlaD